MIVNKDSDELSEVSKKRLETMSNYASLELTILPTINCNLNCKYCYQKNLDYDNKRCSIEDLDNVIKYISNNLSGVNNLSISWSGGEPTLELDNIEYSVNKLKDILKNTNINFEQTLCTNLYNIDREDWDKIMNIGINVIETTLAGNSKHHNILRSSDKNDNVHENVISNINYGLELDIFNILLNINVSTLNVHTLNDIIDFLDKTINNKKRLFIVFHNVESYKNNVCDNLVVSNDIYHKNVIQSVNYALDKNFNICDSTCFSSNYIYCGGYKDNSFIIGPGSMIYKCTNSLTEDNARAKLNNLGKLNQIKHIKNVEIDEILTNCKECSYIPYCNGGCIEKYLRNKTYCPDEINYLSEYLAIYYRKLLTS